MKVVKSSKNYLHIREVDVVLEGGILLPFKKNGMFAGSVGEILSGEDKGKLILFKKPMLIKAETKVGMFYFVEPKDVLAYVELDEKEKVVEPLVVDKDVYKEGWR